MTWVMLHATGHNRGLWERALPALCLDLPGHGAAPRVSPPRVEAYADALTPALPERPVLIGHSLGGMVAVELARRPRVGALAVVLLDAPIRLPFAHFPGTLDLMTRVTTPEQFSRVAGFRVDDTDLKERIRTAIREMTPEGLRDAALAASHYDARPGLRGLTCPVLGIYARTSPIAGPIAARQLRAARPRAEIEMVTGGHMFPLEDPAAIRARIEAFLEAPAP